MPIRSGHKRGDYLMVCDDSGLTAYKSEMVRRWDGAWVLKQYAESRHPQEFVRAKPDPVAVPVHRPTVTVTAASTAFPLFVGLTNVRSPLGPAAHLFGGAPAYPPVTPTVAVGIGTARIEFNCIVT